MGEAESLAGRVLAEKYLLIDRLGEGGFGSIWRAEHQVLKSPVAVKLIDLDVARRDGAVERFLREAQATAALRSPHVVQVLDYGVDGDQPFIVMELLEGENLAERLERVGPLAPLEVLRIVTHVARAMSKAHELGIVHRDLKPENVFLVNNGDEEVAKVLDFGVAKIASPVDLDQNTYTRTGSLIGTPYYMSPEQAQGNKTVDHRSDLWALGVITFEMLTGTRPFDGEALGDLVLTICVRSIAVPSAIAPVPVGFDAWFARAVERDPDARFQSAREMALALLRVIEGEEGEFRFTNVEERGVQKPSTSDSGIGVDIPSRPVTSAFAATVRDDALAAGILAPAGDSSNGVLANDDSKGSDEHLTLWSLVGIAVLALAAGAAAVYGVFFLLRAHAASSESLDPSAPTLVRPISPTVATSQARHRFEVSGTSRLNSEASASRAQRSAPGASSVAPELAEPIPEAHAVDLKPSSTVEASTVTSVMPPAAVAPPVVASSPAPTTALPEVAPAPAPAPVGSHEAQSLSVPGRPAAPDTHHEPALTPLGAEL